MLMLMLPKQTRRLVERGGSEWINIIQHDPSMFLKRTTDKWQQNDGEVLSNFGRGVSAARVSQSVCSQSDGQTALYARHHSQMRKQHIRKRLQCSLEHSWTLTLKWKLSFCASNQSKPMFCLLDSGGCEDESCWCWCCQSRPRGLWRGGSEWINVVQDDASMFLKRTTDKGRVTAKWRWSLEQFWEGCICS